MSLALTQELIVSRLPPSREPDRPAARVPDGALRDAMRAALAAGARVVTAVLDQDVEVLLYTAASHEQQRAAAKPQGDGVYEAALTPPRAGTYHLAIASPSVNLPFQRSPRVLLRVVERP